MVDIQWHWWRSTWVNLTGLCRYTGKRSLGAIDVQYIWHLEPCQMWGGDDYSGVKQVYTNIIPYLIKARLHSLGPFVGIQVIWLIYRMLARQCQPLLTLEGWGWPLTVNTPGWKPSPWRWCGPPASTRGQLDPHVLACQPPLWFMGGPSIGWGLPCCPSGADPRSVTGLRPGVSLAPGPIKRPLKKGFRGRGYGV